MKASYPKVCFVPLFVIAALGIVVVGCKKETPARREPTAAAPPTPEQIAKETEFLSDAETIVCELEETTISKLDLPPDHMASFVHSMKRENREVLRQGQITLAGRPLKILLGDRPQREFYLYDTETSKGPYWWGSWSLNSYHKINGKFLEFMLVENGTKIAGRTYKGELGVIKVGKGGRDLEKVEFSGSVKQAGGVSAPVGTIEKRWPESAAECEIPVGDYTAHIISVTYDNLRISISDNYHTNAQGQTLSNKEVVYGIKIRKEKPYVLDFSNEPMVVFDQPPQSKTSFSRGDEINYAAVMIDPDLDIMIRRLDDTSVQIEKETSSGHKYKRPKSLDPNVVITRADGEIVAEGVMPFG